MAMLRRRASYSACRRSWMHWMNVRGRYLTGSELKTAVYGIRQSLKEPPLEELLRQLEEQNRPERFRQRC